MLLTAADQLLARARHLAERRQALLKSKSAQADVDRLTASLKLAVETLLLAYQEEARNSPWYTYAAIRREQISKRRAPRIIPRAWR